MILPILLVPVLTNPYLFNNRDDIRHQRVLVPAHILVQKVRLCGEMDAFSLRLLKNAVLLCRLDFRVCSALGKDSCFDAQA